MEENKQNSKEENVWKPVMAFYAKTTSWVILPLVLAVLFGRNIGEANQIPFFFFIIIGFGITCFGIYREVKAYKKEIEK